MLAIPTSGNIWLYGPATINVEAEPVWEHEYDQLPGLREYMLKVLKRFNGVGLAAPQIGVFKQFALVEMVDGDVMDIVNPDITRMYGRELLGFEACLSIPPGGNGCLVPRQEFVQVDYQTSGNPWLRKSAAFAGRDAVVTQHEIDHLTGTFFIDRASRVEKRKVLESFEKYKSERFSYAKVNSRPLAAACA